LEVRVNRHRDILPLERLSIRYFKNLTPLSTVSVMQLSWGQGARSHTSLNKYVLSPTEDGAREELQ
jgi:hypothetical protein